MMSGTAPRLLLRAAEAGAAPLSRIIERNCPRVRLGMTSVVPYAPSAPVLRNLQGCGRGTGSCDPGLEQETMASVGNRPSSGHLHSRPGSRDLEGIGKWSVRSAGVSGGSAGLESGIRGLRIVNRLAAGSGVEPLPDGKLLRRI